ncbi:MAG: 5'-methylthioadenosine/adenosylhomocysteine nucleosidase [Patescibacteria group bacterium]
MLAIIGAMDSEIEGFKNLLQDIQEEKRGQFIFYKGVLFGKEIILVKSGIGKVLSAITTQKLIDEYSPTHIAMTGVAGSLKHDYKVGDVVVGKDFIQHDVDATVFGIEKGHIPDEESRISISDTNLVNAALTAKLDNKKLVAGRILSGDQFLSEEETKARKYFFDEDMQGDAIDMECAAVAQVCNVNKIPFVAIKTICSELEGNQEEQYKNSLSHVVNNSVSVIEAVLTSSVL